MRQKRTPTDCFFGDFSIANHAMVKNSKSSINLGCLHKKSTFFIHFFLHINFADQPFFYPFLRAS